MHGDSQMVPTKDQLSRLEQEDVVQTISPFFVRKRRVGSGDDVSSMFFVANKKHISLGKNTVFWSSGVKMFRCLNAV